MAGVPHRNLPARIDREIEHTRSGTRKVADLLSRVPEGAGLDEMHPLFDALQAMKTPATATTTAKPSAADFESFERWFVSEGGILNNVRPHAGFAEGAGMVATAAVHAGDVAVSVPWSLMLTESTASRCPSHDALGAAAATFPEVALALHLLVEKHAVRSRFAPYINELPTHFSTPLYWSWPELSALRGSPTLAECLSCIRAAASQFVHFFLSMDNGSMPRFVALRYFTWTEYIWALSVLMTRKNRVPRDPADATKGDMVALIPMWDMHNNVADGAVTTFATASGSECRALRDAQPGDQVYIHYGDRPNMQLFSHNGFILENNPHDIFLVVPKGQQRSYGYFVTTTGEPSPALVELATKLSATVAALCKQQLEDYPTTIQQDRELLTNKSSAMTSVERCAVALRVLEKRAFAKAAGVEVIGDDLSVPLLPVTVPVPVVFDAVAPSTSTTTQTATSTATKKKKGGKKK